ncbi:hypothetical protein EME01_08680 [Sinorhizobium meliloti]|nr:hypothetical protein EME01_08680 [Sinorhizobium meliloti]
MRGRASGHTATDPAAVDDGHFQPRKGELIGHRKAGNTGTDDNNVDVIILPERGGIRRDFDRGP